MIDGAMIRGMKVTVMGLGLHGGGLASARFFATRGAAVTVTDLRPPEVLGAPMEKLDGLGVRFVLGRHEEADFSGADLVIKNPAVAPTSPFLQAARAKGIRIETDISVFLSLAPNPVIAVTGSKGKSTTASAISFCLSRLARGSRLGGNITVSPLDFLEGLEPSVPVVLELSSWQLADLAGRGVLKPVISAFTVILPDHLDKYPGMAEYISDKKAIFREQEPGSCAVFNRDDPWQADFPGQTKARSYLYSSSPASHENQGGWLQGDEGMALVERDHGQPRAVLAGSMLPGMHNRMNLLCAALVLSLYGVRAELIRKALSEFPGVEHRLEQFHRWRGLTFYNDSAATIPHATVQALKALTQPVVLIAGGTDKNIDFSPLAEVARIPRVIILLEGTGTTKMRGVLDAEGVRYEGPFDDLSRALDAAFARAREGDAVLFSPGCTSFGMFLNEFDRGTKYKAAVRAKAAG